MKKMLLPDIVVQLKSELGESIDVILDDGKEATLYLKTRDGKSLTNEEMIDYFDKKSELYVNSDKVLKARENIMKDKEIMGEINKEVMTIPDIMTDPMKMMEEINRKAEERARESVKQRYLIDRESVIKVGGLIVDNEGKIEIESKTVLYDGDKPSTTGIYMYAVDDKKIPIRLVQKNDKYFTKVDNNLINKKQFNKMMKHAIDTVQAYINKEVNSLYRPTFFAKNFRDLDSNVREALRDVTSKEDGESVLNGLIVLRDIINDNFGMIKEFDISLPMNATPLIDFDTFKVETSKKIANISLSFLKRDHDSNTIRECIEDSIDKQDGLELLSTYTIHKKGVGYFNESINIKQLILPIKHFESIIDRTIESIKDFKPKEKSIENDIDK